MNKILYVDHWNKGYRNFLRLDPSFKEKGYETLMLHASSWNHENVQKETNIDGLKIRDISFYNTNRIKNVILRESPSIIIMLNLSFVLDRAIVQICKNLNIKLFYLAHGKLFTPESQKVIKTNLKKNIKYKLLSKFNKKNRLSLYNYFIEMRSLKKIFVFLLEAFRDYTQFTTFPIFSEELRVNKALVYYPEDYNVMINEFGFPEDIVEIVGNPELDFFYNTKVKNKEEYCLNDLAIETTNYVAYIDDGLSMVKNNWDNQMWMDFLKEINEILKEKKIKLVIKLHPRRDINGCETFLKENKIQYFRDLDFKNYLNHSMFALSHFSTVILYALLLNKSVKSPRWGISQGIEQNFPDDVINYYSSKEEFKENLFNNTVDEKKIKEYLSDSLKWFDGRCIDRIITEILRNSNHKC
jgi:hypothetical protein